MSGWRDLHAIGSSLHPLALHTIVVALLSACSNPLASDSNEPRLHVSATAIVLLPGERSALRLAMETRDGVFTLPQTARPWPEAWVPRWSASQSSVAEFRDSALVALQPGVTSIHVTIPGLAADTSAARVVPVLSSPGFAVITTGGGSTCAADTAFRLYCWGGNWYGELGYGVVRKFTATVSARIVPNVDRVVGTDAGARHACAVRDNGIVECWGENVYGQLGDGSRTSRASPVRVNLPKEALEVAAGNDDTCALQIDGVAVCWGRIFGARPTLIRAGAHFRSITVGGQHMCALTGMGEAYCWGRNEFGQLGTGTLENSDAPVAVQTSLRFSAISSGTLHTCGLTTDQRIYCWGNNWSGRLGTGNFASSAVPVPVIGVDRWAHVSAGREQTCAVATTGLAWCWGGNFRGQLGNNAPLGAGAAALLQPSPTRVAGDLRFLLVNAGPGEHTCGITIERVAYCWGWNAQGQIGGGRNDYFPDTFLPLSMRPVMVRTWKPE